MRQGTMVDATRIAAPSSPKNQTGSHDPIMQQSRKGNSWYFGMQAHIGVDDDCGLTHTVVTSGANVNDVTQAQELLQGEEQRVFAEAGYQGVEKRPEDRGRTCTWYEALRPDTVRAPADDEWGRPESCWLDTPCRSGPKGSEGFFSLVHLLSVCCR